MNAWSLPESEGSSQPGRSSVHNYVVSSLRLSGSAEMALLAALCADLP